MKEEEEEQFSSSAIDAFSTLEEVEKREYIKGIKKEKSFDERKKKKRENSFFFYPSIIFCACSSFFSVAVTSSQDTSHDVLDFSRFFLSFFFVSFALFLRPNELNLFSLSFFFAFFLSVSVHL
ncbi:hypothetical protein CSUI_010456 [Cystoisospora suis]|uniref:Transmembrane protein n=1 Tax=Cystoisospora suis TaxID=483139 RepID=A0A2C6KF28_9APIC|nr:hypothetical protein CSUI_010456 [Cystoisospora suis]